MQLDLGLNLGIYNSSSSAPVNWTPAELPNLALWLDAADSSTITLNGSTVSQWSDKSGNARHAVQATAANQPTYVTKGLNGRSIVSFDGSNDALSTNAYTSSNQVGWYAVMRLNAVGHYPMLLSKYQLSPSINGIEFRGVETTGFPSITGAANNAGAGVLSPPSVPVSNSTSLVNRFSILFGLNNVGTSTLHQDGVLIDTKTLSFTNASLPLVIGSRQGATNFMNGLVCEVVETSGVTGALTRERIEGYLAWKWALEANLPVGHPFKNQPPTV